MSRQCGILSDLLYEILTAYETLCYDAMLRLPSTMTTELEPCQLCE